MNKKIISKVGKRHRPEIDMMEYIQTQETIEFDLDKHYDSLSQNDIGKIVSGLSQSKYLKKKYQRDVNPDIEHNDQLVEKIENNEV